jgi:hypothetical protein
MFRTPVGVLRGRRSKRHDVGSSQAVIADDPWAVRRIIVTMLLVVALGGMFAGCGGDSVRSGVNSPHGGRVSIDKTQAESYAHAVNVRGTDVPGMAVSGQEGEVGGAPFGNGMDSCGGGVGRTGKVAAVISRSFTSQPIRERHLPSGLTVNVGPTEGIYSTVYVMRSKVLAERLAAAAGSASTRACLKARRVAHPTKLAGELYKARVEFSSLPQLLAGVQLYGLRESGTLPAAFGDGRTRPPVYVDVIGFPLGQSDIVLRVRSTPVPPQATTERRLLALLLNRAKAYRLILGRQKSADRLEYPHP